MQCTSSVASASSRSANTPVAAKEPKHRMSNETSYNQRAGRSDAKYGACMPIRSMHERVAVLQGKPGFAKHK
eukprot:scaffold236860_cov21-Tisochrysis_lutea.AAC.1